MIRRPPRSTPLYSSAASDVYKRQSIAYGTLSCEPCDPCRRGSWTSAAALWPVCEKTSSDLCSPLLLPVPCFASSACWCHVLLWTSQLPPIHQEVAWLCGCLWNALPATSGTSACACLVSWSASGC